MLINWIVIGISALAAAFALAWLLMPGLRTSIESPKYDVADWDRS